MGSYLDTSFLFKFYLTEPETDEAFAWLERNRGSVWVSALSDIELIASFSRESSLVVGIRAIDNYREDITHGLYKKLVIDDEVFARAEDIAEGYSRQYKLRSLDILHLATALRYGVDSFGTYDKRQAEAATALGLKVLPERS